MFLPGTEPKITNLLFKKTAAESWPALKTAVF